jgi:hypothetical protein
MGSAKKAGAAGKSVVVIAGEGQNDRDVLRHLVPALEPWPVTRRPKPVEVKKKMALSKAQDQLIPLLRELRLLAQGTARLANARLAGIVVHVDFDAVIDERYEGAPQTALDGPPAHLRLRHGPRPRRGRDGGLADALPRRLPQGQAELAADRTRP